MSHRLLVRRLMGLASVMALVLSGAFAEPAAASVSQEGRIAYVYQAQIYTVSSTGSDVRKLTSLLRNMQPKWSPDGTRIAFVREDANGSRTVWLMNGDGTGQRPVTVQGLPKSAGSVPLSWSPDGTSLLYGAQTDTSNPTSIVLVKKRVVAPLGPAEQIKGFALPDTVPSPLQVDGSASWSADGRHIVYYSHQYPDSPDNYLLSYDTESQRVTPLLMIGGECCGEGYYADVTVARSSRALSYTSYRYKRGTVDPANVVWSTAVRGYDPDRNQLISGPAPGSRIGDRQAAFSSDGSRLVLMNGTSGSAKLYLASTTDLSVRVFLRRGYQPDWQPRS